MYIKNIALAAAALLLAASAQAEIAVTAEIGTTGVGSHLIFPMEKTLNARFGASYFQHKYNESAGTLNYTMKAKLQNIDLLFDWHLIDNSPFRLTGGLVYNGNKISMVARQDSNSNYTINGKTYAASQVGILNGGIEYQKSAPYLGVGWGNALSTDKKWQLSADLGALWQGHPDGRLVHSGCTVASAACAQLGRDVAVERVKMESDIKAYKVYPVLRAGVSYRF
ncbi:hypothetical protein [Massilia antarctica]|uniref:hypothetical protein n=1 Tax=Massilia antarctica TaxID=2765360 RepID=UPI0006BB85A2|nr:hypothetical protein [Massilia sp. H27-R4]MCY0910579.1 hypothetical protein [Massilia sp. H27-R4]